MCERIMLTYTLYQQVINLLILLRNLLLKRDSTIWETF